MRPAILGLACTDRIRPGGWSICVMTVDLNFTTRDYVDVRNLWFEAKPRHRGFGNVLSDSLRRRRHAR